MPTHRLGNGGTALRAAAGVFGSAMSLSRRRVVALARRRRRGKRTAAKVPARRATEILLANSDGLAIPFQLEAGDVTRSPFALVLLRMLL